MFLTSFWRCILKKCFWYVCPKKAKFQKDVNNISFRWLKHKSEKKSTYWRPPKDCSPFFFQNKMFSCKCRVSLTLIVFFFGIDIHIETFHLCWNELERTSPMLENYVQSLCLRHTGSRNSLLGKQMFLPVWDSLASLDFRLMLIMAVAITTSSSRPDSRALKYFGILFQIK